MTNKEWLISDNRRLADALISIKSYPDYDEDCEGYTYQCGSTDFYVAPDGSEYWSYDEALEYTIKWLNRKAQVQ